MRILDVEAATPAEGRELGSHLVEGEAVQAAFASAVGAVLFTDRRIVLVQREHLLEEKVETTSWPWRELRHFALQESAGGGRAMLRLWLGDDPQPLHLRAASSTDLRSLERLLVARLD
jgi:Bacterial PH domain